MFKDFYTVEECEELSSLLCSVTDSVKYLFNIPLNHEDSKIRTPELMEAYQNVYYSCVDFIKAYEYYLKAENYLCADSEAMLKHIEEYLKALKNK